MHEQKLKDLESFYKSQIENLDIQNKKLEDDLITKNLEIQKITK